MSNPAFARESIAQSVAVLSAMRDDVSLHENIAAAADILLKAFRAGGKVLIAGNGGSAADAQHISAEFVSRLKFNRPALPSIALTTDTSIITAIGNDYGFETLFARQVEAYGQSGDVFWGITTSGRSPNVLRGLQAAKDKGLVTVVSCGMDGLVTGGLADIELKSPSRVTANIQEGHIVIAHIVCDIVERTLFGGGRT